MPETQGNLFDMRPTVDGLEVPVPRTPNARYDLMADAARHDRQRQAVVRLMSDGKWRTYVEIGQALGIQPQSAGARMRDLRKEQYGAHDVPRRHRPGAPRGTFEYRIGDSQ